MKKTRDLDRLQGAWSITFLEMDGEQMLLPDFGDARVTLASNRFRSSGMGMDYEGVVALREEHEAVIPGYPKIQIDDVVRIYERVTNETFYHYVLGIKSELNMQEGVWTYSLDTHWLGEHPQDSWVINVNELSNATKQYLDLLGYEGKDDEDKADP